MSTRPCPPLPTSHEGNGQIPPRPPRPVFIPANIPAELQALATGIVAWRYTWKPATGKWDKPPLSPSDLRMAKLPNGTGSFQQALAAYDDRANDLDGPGLCPNGLPFVIIDLDGCIVRVTDEDTEEEIEVVLPWAEQLLDLFGSYTERSPSGTGLRMVVGCKIGLKKLLPKSWKVKKDGPHKKCNVEIIVDHPYGTLTGDLWPGEPTEIKDRTSELEAYYNSCTDQKERSKSVQAEAQAGERFTDEEVLKLALSGAGGRSAEKFRHLFEDGDLAEVNGDWSNADWRLCLRLAFYTGPCPDQIDRLFHRSALHRPKWDERRGGTTYGRYTIDNALSKFGPDDFYAPAAAKIAVATGDPDLLPNESGSDPHRLARVVAEKYQFTVGKHVVSTLWRWQGIWVDWANGQYTELPDSDLESKISGVLCDEFNALNIAAIKAWEDQGRVNAKGEKQPPPCKIHATKRLKGDVKSELAADRNLEKSGYSDPPTWIVKSDETRGYVKDLQWEPKDILACRNVLVHLPTMDVIPATPEFFTLSAIQTDFDIDAPQPVRFLQFLKELWPDDDDQDSINTLQEFFGYCLTTDTSQQKILCLIGPTRAGKGTINQVLQELSGEGNFVSSGLTELASHFGLQPAIGKRLMTIADARLSGKSDHAQLLERILKWSGEDIHTIDRKNKDPWTGKLRAKIVILSNELISIADASGAFVGRLICLSLTKSFLGKEDIHLADKLIEELPGILLWAIEGWRRLQKNGRFTQPKSGKEDIEEMAELGNPILGYLRECFTEDWLQLGDKTEKSVSIKEAYDGWRLYCLKHGNDRPGKDWEFGKRLRAARPCLPKKHQRRDGEDRVWEYRGIQLTDEFLGELAKYPPDTR